jgi:WD40 repeat protein
MDKKGNSSRISITARVDSYEDNGGVFYYNCKFRSGEEENASEWTIRKRFSEFLELQKNLEIKYSDLPGLPATTWTKVTDPNILDERKRQLGEYLQTLCRKDSLSNDSDFHSFINLEENMHNKVSFNKEKMIYKFPDVDFGVREFVLVEDQKIVMAVCSEENLQNRLISYWDNISIPFISNTSSSSAVGSLVIFKIISQDPWHVEKMFTKTFKSQATSLFFDKHSNALAIGLDGGKIRIFDIPKDFKFNKDVKYETNVINAHTGVVNGVCIDSVMGYVYSIGSDGQLCVSDRTSCELYWSKQFDKFELTSLYHDSNNKRLFIGDNSGMIHVFSIKKYPPKRLTSINTSTDATIKSIECSEDMSKMFAGTSEGNIICFNLGAYGKEKKDTKEFDSVLKGKTKCISLCWDSQHNNLLCGNESGNVAVWSPEDNK